MNAYSHERLLRALALKVLPWCRLCALGKLHDVLKPACNGVAAYCVAVFNVLPVAQLPSASFAHRR